MKVGLRISIVICSFVVGIMGGTAWAGAAEDLAMAADANGTETSRMASFYRLVERGNTDIDLVVEVSGDDTADSRKRWVAVRVLGQVGGDRSRNQLLKLLNNDMPAMRAAAAQGLGDFGHAAGAEVSEAIEAKLLDPAIIVRAGAAEALGKLGKATSVGPLSQALSAEDSYYRGASLWVRSHYVISLGLIGDRSAIPALIRCLDDEDEKVAAAAIGAFEAIAGFQFSDGRTESEEVQAWRRWGTAQVR